MTPKDKIAFVAMAAAMAAGDFRLGWGVSLHSPWWTHLAFHFAHGNIFHLAGNLLAVWLYCKSGKVGIPLWVEAFTIATLLSFLYPFTKPLLGFSGIVFVVLGVFLPRLWHNRSVRLSMLTLAVLSALSLLFHQLPAVVFHALCLAAGIALAKAKELTHEIRKEEKRRTDRGADR
jgi:membrane associated rhomboid family serine protease